MKTLFDFGITPFSAVQLSDFVLRNLIYDVPLPRSSTKKEKGE